jgi:hypothetical protein
MMGIHPRIACTALAMLVLPAVAAAQQGFPPQQQQQPAPPAVAPVSPVCGRLETQLAAIDRGAADPARADRTRRIEDTLNKQQQDLDRAQAQWQRLGCQPTTLFTIFVNQPAQCAGLNNQISQIRAGIDRTTMDLERSRHSGGGEDEQRQAVIGALAQNNCGAQYRAAVAQRPKNFLESIFGGGNDNPEGPLPPGMVEQQIGGGGFRTLCVRTCDGYYFPISFSTSQARFAEDEQTCQKLCPATEAVLYTHRNPGEDVAQAISSTGNPYTKLANAFRYRREFVASCSCKQPGQTWAEALGATRDQTIERGDKVVTEERAKVMSQPQPAGRSTPPARQDPKKPATGNLPIPAATDTPPDAATAVTPPAGKRPVRVVGPTFVPQQQ